MENLYFRQLKKIIMAGDELIEANHYNSKQCMMIKEIPSLKKLYYNIVLSTQEANNSLLNALKLLNALSSSIKGVYFDYFRIIIYNK